MKHVYHENMLVNNPEIAFGKKTKNKNTEKIVNVKLLFNILVFDMLWV